MTTQLLEDVSISFDCSNPTQLKDVQSLQFWQYGRELTQTESGDKVYCDYYYDEYYALYHNANLDETDENYGWIGMIRKDTPSLTYWHTITDIYPSQFSAHIAFVEAIQNIKNGDTYINFSD